MNRSAVGKQSAMTRADVPDATPRHEDGEVRQGIPRDAKSRTRDARAPRPTSGFAPARGWRIEDLPPQTPPPLTHAPISTFSISAFLFLKRCRTGKSPARIAVASRSVSNTFAEVGALGQFGHVGIALNPLPAHRLELLAERALDQIVCPLDTAHGPQRPGGASSGMICRRLRR
jgi:hypothetical protein